ncbi:AAA domain-containing protein [Dyella sp.]|uniref:AAA domain-containing protein n=1 Tax=Dyella sp. TaxID=1869338 RepID=UPI002851069B|nr:AAA domain-containing protein [Dyella sp.]MDR3447445.1 AAA domain-containing protein [Dyella sp.]
MKERSRAYAGYWRNSLADASFGKGGLSKRDREGYLEFSSEVLETGRLPIEEVNRLFAQNAPQKGYLEVILRPLVYQVTLEHGKQRERGYPAFVVPICTIARLTPDGRLYPQEDTLIPRDLLEPIERGAFALGAVDVQDQYLTRHRFEAVTTLVDNEDPAAASRFSTEWGQYVKDCHTLLNTVGYGFADGKDGFLLTDKVLLVVRDAITGASQHILRLYDHLRGNDRDAPLFDTYANETITAPESRLPSHAGFAARLAHSGDAYALANAQRDALSHLLAARHGEVLAVNGPPGTGKTTLLLSVVATQWARAALADAEPPVIIAASTNNQAVTNIIDAFGKDFAVGNGLLAGRWLPDIGSFGAYFPSKSKEADAAQKYQTLAFFHRVETLTYLDRAEPAYLEAGRAAFPHLSGIDTATIVAQLRNSLKANADKLATIESSWHELSGAREKLRALLGDHPQQAIAALAAEVRSLQADAEEEEKRLLAWGTWRASQPLLYELLAWLPPVKKHRMRQAVLYLRQNRLDDHHEPVWTDLDQIESHLQDLRDRARGRVAAHRKTLVEAERLQQAMSRALQGWQNAIAVLAIDPALQDVTLADIDALADVQLRFPNFLLATHYWEGRWLLEMRKQGRWIEEENNSKKRGPKLMMARWRRRMMLTPCAVSTFHMLPALMQTTVRGSDETFANDYLYDFADLLIVDEAGQVLPDVAGASFALAKQALVIGDTLQIEPIWAVPTKVDIGNLIGQGLIDVNDTVASYERLLELGKTSAGGSVMKIAQSLTRYHYDDELPRGMFLYEHRRCYDDIIGFCNDLCYHGKLIPCRGCNVAEQIGYPTLGYLHVDGIGEFSRTGSRHNLLEAETLAAWLAYHAPALCEAYPGKPLGEIVGVITPFAGQVEAIRVACQARNIAVNGKQGVTVGTVHALQGAERPVVIFSAVYSKHEDGNFIDSSASMLNVAVSRAKDRFYVFGDMDLFEIAPLNRPRGLLASYLFARPENALQFEYLPRPDLKQTAQGITTLRDAREHDDFLLKLFGTVNEEVHLVTPWIILERVHTIGAMDAMRTATSRGVRIRVYTDPDKVAGQKNANANRSDKVRLLEAKQALEAIDVELLFVRRVHSKSLTGDNNVYCNGSFNWFSANREEKWANHETSFAYRGPAMANDIKVLHNSLQQRLTHISSD